MSGYTRSATQLPEPRFKNLTDRRDRRLPGFRTELPRTASRRRYPVSRVPNETGAVSSCSPLPDPPIGGTVRPLPPAANHRRWSAPRSADAITASGRTPTEKRESSPHEVLIESQGHRGRGHRPCGRAGDRRVYQEERHRHDLDLGRRFGVVVHLRCRRRRGQRHRLQDRLRAKAAGGALLRGDEHRRSAGRRGVGIRVALPGADRS